VHRGDLGAVERSTHWLTGLLLLAAAGLGTVIALELAGSVAIAPEVTAAAPAGRAPEAPAEAEQFKAPPERQFEEISNRPLFFPSRRPFVPAAAGSAEAAPAADPAAAIVLIGVLLTEERRAALVQAEGEPRAHWVHEQQSIAGRVVEAIAADHVRLRDGDHVEVLKLRPDLARVPAKSEAKPERRPKAAARPPAAGGTAEQAEAAPVR